MNKLAGFLRLFSGLKNKAKVKDKTLKAKVKTTKKLDHKRCDGMGRMASTKV